MGEALQILIALASAIITAVAGGLLLKAETGAGRRRRPPAP